MEMEKWDIQKQKNPVEILSRQVETLSRAVEMLAGAVETQFRAVETPSGALETLNRQVKTRSRAVQTLGGALETHSGALETRLFCSGEGFKRFFLCSEHSFAHFNCFFRYPGNFLGPFKHFSNHPEGFFQCFKCPKDYLKD